MANNTFQVNEKIHIELIGGERAVEGDFVQMNKTCITLKNGIDLPSGKRYRHKTTYYFTGIKDCYAVNDRERIENRIVNKDMSSTSEADNSSTSINSSHLNNSSNKKSSPVAISKKTFGHEEIQCIENSMKNAIYIGQYDDKYHGAINDLKQQKLIAVDSEYNFGRLNPMRPLIAITSGQRVYLFDMLRLDSMKKEFKEIFSAASPRKIIHRSTHFNDYLIHTEKCTMSNAFDTLMVHFTLKQTRECISLLDCLKIYFDLPEESFKFAGKNFNFGARPLSVDAKLRSALNVRLLMELYWYFNDILMKPLHTATEQFSNIYPNIESQVDLMTEMTNGAYPNVENIDLNAVKELEELFADFLVE